MLGVKRPIIHTLRGKISDFFNKSSSLKVEHKIHSYKYYPHKESSYIYYAVVYFQDSFIYFGGYGISDDLSVISKFDSTTRQWSNLGNLVTGRFDHGAIFDGTYFLIIGGYDTHKTEKCSLSGSTMTCQQQQPELTDYRAYPELFLVPGDFCKNN